MDIIAIDKAAITQIPIPAVILKGDWEGSVYAISTETSSIDEHLKSVDNSVSKIIQKYNDTTHYTVSLREVKREVVLADERVMHFCSLVQFRVRDSY